MLVLLRIIFTGGFIWVCVQAREEAAQPAAAADDLRHAFWLVCGVLLAIACAVVWAPFIGAKVADPLTGGLVESPYQEPKNYLLRLIRWFDKRKHPALVRWLCFLEGIRAPWLPTGFIIGLHNSRPGSWLEKVYAREVFKFNNAENCMKAFQALQRHGIDPRPHASPDVNIVLMSLERETAPDRDKLAVPPAPPPPEIKRDERIQIGKQE